MVMVESSITTFVSACARKGLLAKIETQRLIDLHLRSIFQGGTGVHSKVK